MTRLALPHARDPCVRQAVQATVVAQGQDIYRFNVIGPY